jgi:hypothetical protein
LENDVGVFATQIIRQLQQADGMLMAGGGKIEGKG